MKKTAAPPVSGVLSGVCVDGPMQGKIIHSREPRRRIVRAPVVEVRWPSPTGPVVAATAGWYVWEDGQWQWHPEDVVEEKTGGRRPGKR